MSSEGRTQLIRIVQALSVIGLIACILLWLYQILLPAPLIIETEQSGGEVYFSANRSIILSSGDCVQLRWQVDRIRNVYLNGQPQIGMGESEMCITDQMPTLTVQFQDDSQHDYQLDITTLAPSLLTLAIIGFTVLTGITHAAAVKQLIQHPRHLAVLLSIFALLLILLFGYLIPLSETIATATWLEASSATKNLLSGIALGAALIFLAMMITRNVSQPNTAKPVYSLVAFWAAGFAITFGIVAAAVVLINPLGMYFSSPYASYQLLLRGSKTDAYRQQNPVPDVVIMGSSRAFTLSPDYINRQTGYRVYNMAIEGGRIEDILIQVRQMQNFPKVMLIEIQDGLPRQPNDIAARAPLNWLPYMDIRTGLLTVQKRLEGLVDINQLAEAIYTARYGILYARQPREWPHFEPNGFAVRQLITPSELEQAILLDIGNIPPTQCDSIDPMSQADVATLVQMANEHDTALVFYMSPWHPQYVEALLQNNPQHQTCHALSADYMNNLDQSSEQIFFLDYSQLESIGGVSDVSGYYDSQHMTEANSQRLLNRALPTLQLAYQSTKQD